MATKILMPQLGESVVEGTVSRWRVQVGDQVKQYDVLLEVSTDKVDTEIPSPVAGTVLSIVAADGETVKAGALIALIAVPLGLVLVGGPQPRQMAHPLRFFRKRIGRRGAGRITPPVAGRRQDGNRAWH